jgi:hypothetical protein
LPEVLNVAVVSLIGGVRETSGVMLLSMKVKAVVRVLHRLRRRSRKRPLVRGLQVLDRRRVDHLLVDVVAALVQRRGRSTIVPRTKLPDTAQVRAKGAWRGRPTLSSSVLVAIVVTT